MITTPRLTVISSGSGCAYSSCAYGSRAICATMHSAVNHCNAHGRKRPPDSRVGCI
jgi:hypothetical protein